jgi:hypothetical protein
MDQPGIPPPPGGSPLSVIPPPSGSKGHPFKFIFFTSISFSRRVQKGMGSVSLYCVFLLYVLYLFGLYHRFLRKTLNNISYQEIHFYVLHTNRVLLSTTSSSSIEGGVVSPGRERMYLIWRQASSIL